MAQIHWEQAPLETRFMSWFRPLDPEEERRRALGQRIYFLYGDDPYEMEKQYIIHGLKDFEGNIKDKTQFPKLNNMQENSVSKESLACEDEFPPLQGFKRVTDVRHQGDFISLGSAAPRVKLCKKSRPH